MQLDTTFDVVTPENIAFHYQAAGPFRRFPAFLIDAGIRVAFMIGMTFLLGITGALAALAGMAMGVLAIVWFIVGWFYGALFETFWNGQTPGKWALGIRVLSVDGQPINGLQATLRTILREADMFPLLSIQMFDPTVPVYLLPTFSLGMLVMATNQRFQRIGDLVSGTVVVVEEPHWLAGVAALEDVRVPQLAAYIPADFRVSRSMAKALAAYVDRRRFFSLGRRREIARHLAEPLVAEWGFPPDTSYDLLVCALYHRTFISDHDQTTDQMAGTPLGRHDRSAAAHLAAVDLAAANPFAMAPVLASVAAGATAATGIGGAASPVEGTTEATS